MRNNKKIIFLFPHFLSPGGAANVVLSFAKELQSRDYQIKIICAKASREFLNKNNDLNIKQLKIPTSNSLFYWLLFPFWQIRINKILSNYKNCILFPHVLPSNWWAWIYKRKNENQNIIWYCHEPSAFIHSKKWINAIGNPVIRIGAKILNPILKKIDISLEKQDNLVVCNSQFTAKEYKRCYNKKAEKIIYPPIEIKHEKISQDKEKYLLSVGKLSKFKNINILIDAFEKISKIHPEYSLILIGDGEEKKNLEKLTTKKCIEDKVSFLGKVSNERRNNLYRKARATILCSKNEPFGIVPIESMMYGTPVIVHNSGGPKETINHNSTGLLFKDKNDLFNCMKKIMEINSVLYLKMQRNCQKKAMEYDPSNSISKLENILIKK
jgi:glycosyltransferase involved in cell wall biosynthesis